MKINSIKKPVNSGIKIIEELLDEHIDESQALVKVLSVGLCRTDLYVANGRITTEQDLILGHEACVEIIDCKRQEIVGLKAAINPLWPDKRFLGLDINGVLTSFAKLPISQLITTRENLTPELIAYLEPIAASYAIKNCSAVHTGVGAIIGSGRIADLTYKIAKTMGLNIEFLDSVEYEKFEEFDYPENKYDWIIETQMSQWVVSSAIKMLKEKGTLIIKSRSHTPIHLIANDLVKKQITLQGVNYADFHESMRWLEKNKAQILPLIGRVYRFEDYKNAFEEAMNCEKNKIFIKVSE